MRCPFVLLVMLAVPVSAVGAPANHRPLTMRKAERSIDLAWLAELNGDHAGARQALRALVTTSSTSDEIAARARLEEWLGTLDAREALTKQYGRTSARYYSGAHVTLKNFGIARSNLLWAQALVDIRGLRGTLSSTGTVSLKTEFSRAPIDGPTALRLVERTLKSHGITVVKDHGRFEAGLNLVASTSETLQRGFRAVASAGLKVRERGSDGKLRLVANVDRSRTEVRPAEPDAQRFAARRALDDAAEGLVFHIRSRLLEEASVASDSGTKPPDKAAGARL